MNKTDIEIIAGIVGDHYVKLGSKKKLEAAAKYPEYIRIYEDEDGNKWAKAITRDAYDAMAGFLEEESNE